jgi:superfamily II DNA/RNA helicase
MFKKFSSIIQTTQASIRNAPVFSRLIRQFAKNKEAAPKRGIPSFQNYDFIDSLTEYMQKNNIMSPSPIQQLSYSYLMQTRGKTHKPIFLGGPTGSGKTYAYLLPIIHALKMEEEKNDRIGRLPNRPRAIILAPSKELITQIYDIAKEISHIVKLKVEKIDGASNWARRARELDGGVDILITNINKFERLTKEKKIQLSAVKYFVVDEADVFIENGSEEQMVNYVKEIYLKKQEDDEADVQMVYVSATLTNALRIFLETVFDKNIKFLLTTDTHFNLANLQHTFVPVLQQNKLELLRSEILKIQKKDKQKFLLVFCNSVAAVRAVDYYLRAEGIRCSSLHSDMPIRLRAESYQNFKNKQSNVMICSDLVARGLDFTHLDGVINFDFPKNINDYLHRAGRAGRIGNFGIVVNLYQNKDMSLIKQLEESYEKKIPLEITQSSFALKNKEDKNKNRDGEHNLPAMKDSGRSSVPQEYSKFHRQVGDQYALPKLGRGQKADRKRSEIKKPKNVLRSKIRELKGSIKSQLKINPNSKRAAYLKRELKYKHKERLGITRKDGKSK